MKEKIQEEQGIVLDLSDTNSKLHTDIHGRPIIWPRSCVQYSKKRTSDRVSIVRLLMWCQKIAQVR